MDRRVEGAGNVYAHEKNEVRLAATYVRDIADRLSLGPYVESLVPPRDKPQFLLVFEKGEFRSRHERLVLKVYGRSFPGEGLVQHRLTQANVPVVPTLAFGDEPSSWLLMEPVSGRDLSRELSQSPERLIDRTVELARVMNAFSVSAPTWYSGVQSLQAGILHHLDKVVGALLGHGYETPPRWRQHAIATYQSGRRLALHNDLFSGNIRITDDEALIERLNTDLLVLDSTSDSCLGAPEFDAARWIARESSPDNVAQLIDAWKQGAPDTDLGLLNHMLSTELLMCAGVNEIIKDERGLPWAERDTRTMNLLEMAASFQIEAPGFRPLGLGEGGGLC